MKRALFALVLMSSPALARDSLGVFEGWGAFRDAQPTRCYAISSPARSGGNGRWRPFASVAHWPLQRVRGQLHIRLSRVVRRGAALTLTIDDRRWPLVAGKADAWAPDGRFDAAIIAAMRSGRSMSVEAVAATAIDAAALGCARR
jgi:hypothetical protein